MNATVQPAARLVDSLKVPVFVGGHQAKHHRQRFERCGAQSIGDDVAVGLVKLGARLPLAP